MHQYKQPRQYDQSGQSNQGSFGRAIDNLLIGLLILFIIFVVIPVALFLLAAFIGTHLIN